jgi:hypothetical protein
MPTSTVGLCTCLRLLVCVQEALSSRLRWYTLFTQVGEEVFAIAKIKLLNGLIFYPADQHHALAVLSQRLCIDPAFSHKEALKFVERSISHHMKPLIGITDDRQTLYTFSPSEPALVLAAAHIIFMYEDCWASILDTFNKGLCQAGLVEKGLLGELAARTLLLITRDFASPLRTYEIKKGVSCMRKTRDVLRPIRLLDFLDKLFGNRFWCRGDRERFEEAFHNTYVNFSHWMVTKDALPQKSNPYVTQRSFYKFPVLNITLCETIACEPLGSPCWTAMLFQPRIT